MKKDCAVNGVVTKGAIFAPVPQPVEKTADVAIADCCQIQGSYNYTRINGQWYQVGWVAANQEKGKTFWKSWADKAVACQACGQRFGPETPLRRYHAGAFAPLDSMVQALTAAPATVAPESPATATGN